MAPEHSILSFLKTHKTFSKEAVPEGYCPNCWGRQEYGGEFYSAVRNYSHDVDSRDPHDGWILDYAKKHLEGIQLIKENDRAVCQNCKMTYYPEK